MTTYGMAWVASALCVAGLVGVVWAEYSEHALQRALCKPVASIGFVVLGILLQSESAHPTYAQWVLAGLVLGALGDVALLSKSSKGFLLGLVNFLLGHLAYVVACATLVSWYTWASPVALVPVVAAAIVLRYLWAHLGAMRAAVIAYVATIVCMVVGALAVYQSSTSGLSAQSSTLLFIGALLFFASDVAVAKSRFVKAVFADKLWGLPAYYFGQLCIAWSLA